MTQHGNYRRLGAVACRRWLLKSTLAAMTDDELWGLVQWNLERMMGRARDDPVSIDAREILKAIHAQQETRVGRTARLRRRTSKLADFMDD